MHQPASCTSPQNGMIVSQESLFNLRDYAVRVISMNGHHIFMTIIACFAQKLSEP